MLFSFMLPAGLAACLHAAQDKKVCAAYVSLFAARFAQRAPGGPSYGKSKHPP